MTRKGSGSAKPSGAAKSGAKSGGKSTAKSTASSARKTASRSERKSASPVSKTAASKKSKFWSGPVAKRLLEIENSGGGGNVDLPEGELAVTSLGKLYFPEAGYTKGDLLRYYATVAPLLLPAIADRPLILRRYPEGIHGDAFYQQKAPASVPDNVRTELVVSPSSDDGELLRFIGGDLTTLLYTVQLGAISVDPWHGRVGDPEGADWSVIDLDPGPKATFAQVVEVALHVRDELEALGLTGVPKTSGASGIHIMIPLVEGTPSESARLVAQMVAESVVKRAGKGLATVTRTVSRRPAASVYVDYLQNIVGKSVASVYAARAREAASVSTPLEWSEVNERLDPRDFTIETVIRRFDKKGDLWKQGMRKGNDLRSLIE